MTPSGNRWLIALAVAGIGAGSAVSAQKAQVIERDQVRMTFRALNASIAPGTPGEALELVVPPDLGGETRFSLLWPDQDTRVEVVVRGTERPTTTIDSHVIALEADVTLGDGREIRSTRVLPVSGETTALFELHSEGEHTLTLAIVADTERLTVVSRTPEVGAPIRFHVEIQRVESGGTVPLETNRLNTFVGQSVEYSFDLGGAEADAARLRLLPIRAQGDVAVIDVELTGRLPTEDGPQLISHSERWVSSRGVASIASLEHGDPPTGYRFVVTPDF